MERAGLFLLVLALTLVSGMCDAQGFLYASKIWGEGQIQWGMVLRSALGFATGISLYYVLLGPLTHLGIHAAEVQTLMWFGVTLVAVALARGEFMHWNRLDQLVGVMVLAGIAWLMVRNPA